MLPGMPPSLRSGCSADRLAGPRLVFAHRPVQIGMGPSATSRGDRMPMHYDHDDARNAVNGAVATGIEAAIDELEADDALVCGVLAANGPVFCAGADLKLIAAGRGNEMATARGGFAGLVRRRRDEAAGRRHPLRRAGRRVRDRAGVRSAGRRRGREARAARGEALAGRARRRARRAAAPRRREAGARARAHRRGDPRRAPRARRPGQPRRAAASRSSPRRWPSPPASPPTAMVVALPAPGSVLLAGGKASSCFHALLKVVVFEIGDRDPREAHFVDRALACRRPSSWDSGFHLFAAVLSCHDVM